MKPIFSSSIAFLNSIVVTMVGGIGDCRTAVAQTSQSPMDSAIPISNMAQLNLVSQLTDVKPDDWAFQALQSIANRYSCLTGYPDQTYRGGRSLTRYEFAAGLQTCIEQLNQRITTQVQTLTDPADLATLKKLQTDFVQELADLQGQVRSIETQVDVLKQQQFAPTTKMIAQAVMAFNVGGFTKSDTIVSPLGATITTDQPQATTLYRSTIELNSSFTGQDLLKLRLVTGSLDARDNAAGFLEPNLASTLEFSLAGRNDRLSVSRLYYTFTPRKDLTVTIGPQMVAADFVDRNRYANIGFLDFSSVALVYTFALLPRPVGAGAVVTWRPQQGPFKLRGLYLAGDPANLLPKSPQVLGGGKPGDLFMFPTAGGGARGGLWSDPNQGFVEVEYSPSSDFTVRLQGTSGRLFGSTFVGGGINFDWAIGKRVGIFGRYVKAYYSNTSFGTDITPQNWSAGLVLRDGWRAGDLLGLGVGQPFATDGIGDATQTNFEVFYNFPVSPNLRITPLLQVITHPGNREANGAIVSGTIRTVFSF